MKREKSLHRTIPNQPPKRSFLVITEGERTEVQYINYWHKIHRERVTVNVDELHGQSPLQLVRQASQLKKADTKKSKLTGAPYDEVWCVFDRDAFTDLHEAFKMAKDNDIRVAFSNPCIELWFVLHFEEQNAHVERHPIQKRSGELIKCEKALNTKALEMLAANHQEAVNRAQTLAKRHLQNNCLPPDDNPSSTLWKLIEAIRDA